MQLNACPVPENYLWPVSASDSVWTFSFRSFLLYLRKFLYGHAFSAQYYLDLFSKCKIFHALPPSRIFTSDRKCFYFPSPNFSHCSKSHFMRQSQSLFFRYRKKRVSIPACEIKTLPAYFCICARYSSSVIPFSMIAFAASSPT